MPDDKKKKTIDEKETSQEQLPTREEFYRALKTVSRPIQKPQGGQRDQGTSETSE